MVENLIGKKRAARERRGCAKRNPYAARSHIEHDQEGAREKERRAEITR